MEQKSSLDPIYNVKIGTEFTDRLKKMIGNRSGRAFAKEVGISYSTLHNYLTNTSKPTLENLVLLSEHCDVSLDWLALGKEPEESIIKYDDDNDDGFEFITDCRNIHISAGFGAENNEYFKEDITKVERDWLIKNGLKADNCAMFRVSGDSMYPTLKDHEDIVVDCSKKELKEGKIFVINHNGTLWVKTIQITFNGVKLISDNPTYPPISLTQEESNELTIIGEVKRGYRDF